MDKLDSHILNRRKYVLLERDSQQKMLGLEILTFEALSNLNSTQAIRAFAEDVYESNAGSHHFANPVIAGLWCLYDSFAPDFKLYHKFSEMQERRRFARRPLYAAVTNEKVVGGLWVDSVHSDKKGKHASIHIFTDKNYRGQGIAETILDVFERDAKIKYDFVSCSWGPRDDCSPARLFEKKGYSVEPKTQGGTAYKNLNVPVLEFELVKTS